MFKVNNKDTVGLVSCSSVTIVNFEDVIPNFWTQDINGTYIRDKVFKNGPSEILVKAVFHKFHLVHS